MGSLVLNLVRITRSRAGTAPWEGRGVVIAVRIPGAGAHRQGPVRSPAERAPEPELPQDAPIPPTDTNESERGGAHVGGSVDPRDGDLFDGVAHEQRLKPGLG